MPFHDSRAPEVDEDTASWSFTKHDILILDIAVDYEQLIQAEEYGLT